MDYIATYLLNQYITPADFKKYVINMAEKYKEGLPLKHDELTTADRVLDYIFGHHFTIGERLRKRLPETSPIRLLYKILLDVFFHEFPEHYFTKAQRNSVYKKLGYTEKEIEAYEERFKNNVPDWTHIHAFSSKNVDVSVNFSSGYTLEQLGDLICDYIIKMYKKKSVRKIPMPGTLYKEAKKNIAKSNSEASINLNVIMHQMQYYNYLISRIEEVYLEITEFYQAMNSYELSQKKDKYVCWYKKGKDPHSCTFDLSVLKSDTLKEEFRLILRALCDDKNSIIRFKQIIDSLVYFEKEFGVQKLSDINENYILLYLHHLNYDEGKAPGTLSDKVLLLRKMFKIAVKQSYDDRPIYNPLSNISFTHLRDKGKSTPCIPDDVLVFLKKHINELSNIQYQLQFRLLMETGWRYQEIRGVQVSDIVKASDDDYDGAIVTTEIKKTRKARINRGLGNRTNSYITESLYNDLMEFVEDTQAIREHYNIKTLFYCIKKGKVSSNDTHTFNKSLNNLLNKYGMTSIDEDYSGIYAMQTRKTVAVNLITEGAPLSAVQKQLGHTSPRTTASYYAYVKRKKISEMNEEFFDKEFDIIMSNDNLMRYSEEERRLLYVDFKMKHRDVELGKCSKHPSDGACIAMGQTSCANCPKLCTGVTYLPKWKKMADDSKKIIDYLISVYQANDIPESEYKEYTEYAQEKTQYDRYKAVIKAIEESVK